MRKRIAEDRPNNLNRAERPQHTPIHGFRDKMEVKGIKPGFHACWVNDYNVDAYLAGSYDFVTYNVTVGDKHINAAATEGGKISMPVGNGVIAYLMEIPQEWYEEDMAKLENETDEKERAMRDTFRSKEDGRYGEVKIRDSKPIDR